MPIFPKAGQSKALPPAWESSAWDLTGRYETRYETSPSSDSGQLVNVRKIKTDYVQMPPYRGLGDKPLTHDPAEVAAEGAQNMIFERAGPLVAVDGQTRYQINTRLVRVTGVTRVQVQRVPTSQLDSLGPPPTLGELNRKLQNWLEISLDSTLFERMAEQKKRYAHRSLLAGEKEMMAGAFQSFLDDVAPLLAQEQRVDRSIIRNLQKRL